MGDRADVASDVRRRGRLLLTERPYLLNAAEHSVRVPDDGVEGAAGLEDHVAALYLPVLVQLFQLVRIPIVLRGGKSGAAKLEESTD